MAGSVFLVVLVVVLILVLIGIANPLILIPMVAIGLGLLLVPVVGAALRKTAVGNPGSGPDVPTTREASYDPIQEP
jgi:hypothetical protein